MIEIVITHPELNPAQEWFRRYSYNQLHYREQFKDHLQESEITPVTHPLVADLFAGDGSYAKMLVDNGWEPGNITCFDAYISPAPLVDGASWKFWDLSNLNFALWGPEELPTEVTALKEAFDLVICQGNPIVNPYAISQFLAQSNGYSYHHNWVHTADGIEVTL